jgi:tetratricopeptide (TPR) repeat protein
MFAKQHLLVEIPLQCAELYHCVSRLSNLQFHSKCWLWLPDQSGIGYSSVEEFVPPRNQSQLSKAIMPTEQPKQPGILKRLQAMFYLWSGRVHRHYGIVHADTGEFLSAVEDYQRAVTKNPRLGIAYLERGILLWRELGRSPHAVRDLNSALGLYPDWPEALFNRGMAYQIAGNYEAAAQDMIAYLALDEDTWRDSATRQLRTLRVMLADLNALQEVGSDA